MSNDKKEVNIWERLFKLLAKIMMMIVDGVRDPHEVAEVLQGILSKMGDAQKYLRRVASGLRLDAIDGSGAFMDPKRIFEAGFHVDFERCGITFTGKSSAAKAVIDEVIEDGKFSDFLGASATEVEERRMTGAQFLSFCGEYRPTLSQYGGHARFFVLTPGDKRVKSDLSNAYVAVVHACEQGKLDADLRRYSSTNLWKKSQGNRLVSLE